MQGCIAADQCFSRYRRQCTASAALHRSTASGSFSSRTPVKIAHGRGRIALIFVIGVSPIFSQQERRHQLSVHPVSTTQPAGIVSRQIGLSVIRPAVNQFQLRIVSVPKEPSLSRFTLRSGIQLRQRWTSPTSSRSNDCFQSIGNVRITRESTA